MGQHGGHGVDLADHGVAVDAEPLQAEHPAGAAFGHELQRHQGVLGVEMGPVDRRDVGGHGVESGPFGPGQGQPRAGRAQVEQLDAPRPDGALKARRAAGQIVADDPALAVAMDPSGKNMGWPVIWFLTTTQSPPA